VSREWLTSAIDWQYHFVAYGCIDELSQLLRIASWNVRRVDMSIVWCNATVSCSSKSNLQNLLYATFSTDKNMCALHSLAYSNLKMSMKLTLRQPDYFLTFSVFQCLNVDEIATFCTQIQNENFKFHSVEVRRETLFLIIIILFFTVDLMALYCSLKLWLSSLQKKALANWTK